MKKIRWRCSRRGMLELDLLLTRFFDNHYLQLTETEQLLFQQLLDCPDPQLFAWLMKHEQPIESTIAALIQKIQATKPLIS